MAADDKNFENELFGVKSDDMPEFEQYQQPIIERKKDEIEELLSATASAAHVNAHEYLDHGHAINDKEKLRQYLQDVKASQDPELLRTLPELEAKLEELERVADVVTARNNSEDEQYLEFGLEEIHNFMNESPTKKDNEFSDEEIEGLIALQQKIKEKFAQLLEKGVMKIREVFGGQDSDEEVVEEYSFEPESEKDLEEFDELNQMTAQIFHNIGCDFQSFAQQDDQGNVTGHETQVRVPQAFEGKINVYNISPENIVQLVEARQATPDQFRTITVNVKYNYQALENSAMQDVSKVQDNVQDDPVETQEMTHDMDQDLPEVEAEIIDEPQAEVIPVTQEVDATMLQDDMAQAQVEEVMNTSQTLPIAQPINPAMAQDLPEAQVEEILEAQHDIKEALLHNQAHNVSENYNNESLPTRRQDSENVR